MPGWVIVYLAFYAGLGIANTAMVMRLPGASRRQVLGDVLAHGGWLTLAAAYWVPELGDFLASAAIPIFVFALAWMFVALEPSVRLLRTALPRDYAPSDRAILVGAVAGLLATAPAMIWGLRLCRAALD
jgi:hypothetical protein